MSRFIFNESNIFKIIPAANASFQYDAFNRLTKATYPEKVYDYAYDPFGNMLTAKESVLTVFNKSYSPANRISDFSYDSRGNQTGGNGFTQVWDRRNRLVESRTVANVLLGSYVYNERGLRIKAERMSQPMVLVVEPNGGESLYLGAMNTVRWSGLGLAGGTAKLELLVDGMVAGTIAEGIPGGETSYQWQAGKMIGGWATTGTNYKVRVTAVALPAASGTTYYVYDSGGRLLSEYDGTGTCAKDYLYLGGKMIGEYVPATSSYYYYASDQINSTRIVTDTTGVLVHSAQYDPYGGLYKIWVDAYHPKPGFSGKEREFGSEMDYFGARYYGHGEYRFTSIDPENDSEEAQFDPQLWNLYGYCKNNPISKVDPNGRLIWDIIDVASFAHSTVAFIKNPTLKNAGALALDLVGLLPAVPAIGGTLKIVNQASDVKKAHTAYRSINAAKEVQYVGITNNLARRAAEHLWIKGINIYNVLSGLSKNEARNVEQALIEIHGLSKSGGSLLNKINNVSKINPKYAERLQEGYDLLKKGGYN